MQYFVTSENISQVNESEDKRQGRVCSAQIPPENGRFEIYHLDWRNALFSRSALFVDSGAAQEVKIEFFNLIT